MDNRPFDNKDNDAEIEAQAGARDKGGFWRNPIVRVALLWLLYFVISVLLRDLLGIAFGRPDPFNILNGVIIVDPFLITHPAFGFLLLPLVGSIATLIAIWIMKRPEGWAMWKSIGFVKEGAGKSLLLGLVMGILVQAASIGAISLYSRHPSYGYGTGGARAYVEVMMVFSFVGAIFRAVTIETMFRGFALQELENKWGTFVGIVLSSLFYCLFAYGLYIEVFIQHGWVSQDWVSPVLSELFQGFSAALLFASAYLATRKLWCPIAVHVGLAISSYSASLLGLGAFSSVQNQIFEILAAAGLIAYAIGAGRWVPGPGPRELAQSAYRKFVKIIEMTDPGKQEEPVEQRKS